MSRFEVDIKRATVQNNAVNAWILSNKKGVIEAITGIGKNFIFLKALHTCPKGISVLFLAEQVDREYDLKQDIIKFDSINNTSTMKDYQIEFMTYQSAYKLSNKHWDFVCADEIHDSLTPEYSKFYFNNTYTYFIGLSATIPNTRYITSDGVEYTKRDLLLSIAPICFKYTLYKGQVEGTSRPLNVIVVENFLDDTTKNMEAGSAKKRFMTTEKRNYEYWDTEFNKAMYLSGSAREFRLRITSANRAKILYKLPSKIKLVKEILPKLKGKTLIFGNDLDSLHEITPNVISSRHSEKRNQEIRTLFENGEINVLGSFKKLKQGANLSKLDNIIIMSYYSTTKDLIQRVGRLRKDGNKVGNVIIILTRYTKEEDWFNKMFSEAGIDAKRIKKEQIDQIDELLKYGELVQEGQE